MSRPDSSRGQPTGRHRVVVLAATVGVVAAGVAVAIIWGVRDDLPHHEHVEPAAPSNGPLKPLAERFGGALAYCPPDTLSVTVYDVAALTAGSGANAVTDVLNDNWQKGHFNDQFPGHFKWFRRSGLAMADVEACVSAWPPRDAKEDFEKRHWEVRGLLNVVKFRRAVRIADLLTTLTVGAGQLEERRSRHGEPYHVISISRKLGDYTHVDEVSFCMPDDRTLLVASTRRELEDAIGRGGDRLQLPGPLVEVLTDMESSIIQATTSRNPQPAVLWPGFFASELPGFFGQVGYDPALYKRLAGVVGVSFHPGGVRYREACLLPNDAQAAELHRRLVRFVIKVPKVLPGISDRPAVKEAFQQIALTVQLRVAGRRAIAEAAVDPEVFARTFKDLFWFGPLAPT